MLGKRVYKPEKANKPISDDKITHLQCNFEAEYAKNLGCTWVYIPGVYTSISCILHSILVAFVPMGSKSLTEIGALQWRAGQTRRKLINIKMSSHVLELHPISVLLLHFSPLR